MIQNTFSHLPKIGEVKERLLWDNGVATWEDFLKALMAGNRPADILRGRTNSKMLFAELDAPADKQAKLWTDALRASEKALKQREYDFFLSRLKPSEHWRLLEDCLDEALYLDIESTGLSKELHHVTVVGALHKKKFRQWVWPEALDELWDLMRDSPLIVTFNGRTFDIPFLIAHFADCPTPRAHVDLRYIARKAGFAGGQKAAEKALGLTREKDVEEVHGAIAVALWAQTLYGDRNALKTLLAYNRADVELLRSVAVKLCEKLRQSVPINNTISLPGIDSKTRCFHKPTGYKSVREAWEKRRPGLHLLAPKLLKRWGRLPVVVGIDLRGNPKNPTGFAVCKGSETSTRILYEDDKILEATIAAGPDLVSIDAPLSLPRGRLSVSDDSPCHKTGGIVREAERTLWARHIPVYPSLIRHMQGLTKRGIDLTARLREQGIQVVESYPGAAQDVLGIPRKGVDESLLSLGLREFGFDVPSKTTHDELDAITSALVGYVFLAGEYEAIGADDEGYMILPMSTTTMKWQPCTTEGQDPRPKAICIAGLPGSGKTKVATMLSSQLRCGVLLLGHELRVRAASDHILENDLGSGKLAPETLVDEILTDAAGQASSRTLIIDGFPRHPEQVELADRLFSEWSLLVLDIEPRIAASRIKTRLTCNWCGWVGYSGVRSDYMCPVCNMSGTAVREEDTHTTLNRRLREAQTRLEDLFVAVKPERRHHIPANGGTEYILGRAEEIVDDILDHPR